MFLDLKIIKFERDLLLEKSIFNFRKTQGVDKKIQFYWSYPLLLWSNSLRFIVLKNLIHLKFILVDMNFNLIYILYILDWISIF